MNRLLEPRLPRVLVVTARLDIGGTEQHLLRILPSLRRRGLDVSLFVLERGGKLEEKLMDAGIAVAGMVRFLPRHLHALLAGWELRRHLRQQKPDLLHFFLSEPYLVGSFAAMGMQGRRLMSRRSLNHYQEGHVVLAAIERHLHKKTSALLGNSLAVVSDLVAESGTRDKVGLIRNGIDISDPINDETRNSARKQWRLSQDTVVFAVVANLIPYKGHRDLFAAFGLIVNKLRGPWRLILIGRDQGLGAELHKSAEEAGFADNVLWLGERTDVQDLLNIVDVSVLPSHEEGFSNSLIEAMARGLPAVATTVGGNVEAILHEVTGLLVPPRNPQALADALFRLYEDPVLRQGLGASARARAVSEFSIDDCVGRYLNLYRGWQSIGTIPVQELIDGRLSGRCV